MSASARDWIASPGEPLRGTIDVPGDKSISHRAVMIASLADGTSRIEGFLEGEDTRATAAAFARMGVRIEAPAPGTRIVHGVGIDGLQPPDGPIDCGNAGTGMRLLAGLLAGQRFDSELVGDASLSRRPMQRVIEPLARMGASIEATAEGFPPLRIRGGQALRGIEYALPVASAQVKSAILLAGLLHVLRAMGADIEEANADEQGGEPVADLVVRHAPLRGIELPVEHVADMIDEFPALFVAAACAEGSTTVRGAAELRVKESDRIATMAAGLRALGIAVDEASDGARIHGGRLRGGTIDSHGDHRIAMAFAVAAQVAGDPVWVRDVANVATSFPGFEDLAATAGMAVSRATPSPVPEGRNPPGP